MNNKKGIATFFRKKSRVFSLLFMLVAVFGMSGVYMAQQRSDERYAQEEALRSQELLGFGQFPESPEELQSVDMLLVPETGMENSEEADEISSETDEAIATIESVVEETSPEVEEEIATTDPEDREVVADPLPTLSFAADTQLGWPLEGNVILNYSMDQTVYFATLDQYKYNPAIIIQAQVNDKIRAVAAGRVAAIETNEVTGTTMTVELGSGFSAVYGQLKELPFAVGDYMEAGEVLGYIGEPTKYYSVEGPNLYFQLLEDDISQDPMEYFQ